MFSTTNKGNHHESIEFMWSRMKWLCVLLLVLWLCASFHLSSAFLPAKASFFSSQLVRLSQRHHFSLYDSTKSYRNLDEFFTLAGDTPVLVDFYAKWCSPCQSMHSVLEELANRLCDKVRIAKVDTEKASDLGTKYAVEQFPTLILFHRGEIIDRFVGFQQADDLEKRIIESIESLTSR